MQILTRPKSIYKVNLHLIRVDCLKIQLKLIEIDQFLRELREKKKECTIYSDEQAF